MSEKQFILCQDDLGNYEIRYDDNVYHFLYEVAPILNEQQATINHLKQELGEYKENWDDMVETSTKIALRNVELVEENAKLQKKIDWLCEVFDYGSDESMQKVKEWKRPKDGNV